MTIRPRPLGWEASDCQPLSRSSFKTQSIDSDQPSRAVVLRQSELPATDPELYAAASRVTMALSEIHELPAKCNRCPHRFRGDASEFRVSMVLSEGDGTEPTVTSLCRSCYNVFIVPVSSKDHTAKVARFMAQNGASQTEIAFALDVSQPTVSRILRCRTKRT